MKKNQSKNPLQSDVNMIDSRTKLYPPDYVQLLIPQGEEKFKKPETQLNTSVKLQQYQVPSKMSISYETLF